MKPYSLRRTLLIAMVVPVLISAGLYMAGCGKPPMVTPGTISISDVTVKSTLFDLGVSEATACVLLGSPKYTIPNKDWVTVTFAQGFRAWKDQQGFHYQTGAEDCKAFSRLAALYADMAHAQDPGRQPGTAIAVGEFWYIKDTGAGHAINVALIQDGPGKYKLMFFEPQTQLEVLLSRSEVEHCVMCRI